MTTSRLFLVTSPVPTPKGTPIYLGHMPDRERLRDCTKNNSLVICKGIALLLMAQKEDIQLQSEVRRVSQLGMNSGIRPGFGGFATPVGPSRPSTVVITKIHENFAIDPNPNLNFFASSIYRSYNPMTKRFFLHPNRRLVDLQSGKGFGAAARIGKIISVQTFLRNEEMIRNRCPQLTELFYLTRNGGQFLTTDPTEKFRMQTLGWREVASIGMCVRQPGACGATSPLLEARKSFDDFIYMTNRNEFMKFLATTPQYQAKSEMGVCYVW